MTKTVKELMADVPLQPIDKWYMKFLSAVRKVHGREGWRRVLDEAPDDIQAGLLAIHQAASAAYMERKRPQHKGTKR